ncbi:hypothetical protein MBCUT_18160 [Methanobrevibacter cuticularis]|uniref:DUF2116 family Zn-ribbon domain-containing protein n=1 Tax=Methanobrevibacter cuticularis TaxID=47311 RepID=A0A166CYZ5_9EURY|nr:DUF2116 family Zn-ribbon domain-containing protein [Methanobrevibacter cuticularis]KZX15014.1 hypothetical protein MBCUT_18160 [Methanobrevibacter cuticularis]
MVDIHKHCPVCGTPIPLDEITCSNKCQNVLMENQAKMKRSRILLFIVMIIFIIVFVFMMFFNK